MNRVISIKEMVLGYLVFFSISFLIAWAIYNIESTIMDKVYLYLLSETIIFILALMFKVGEYKLIKERVEQDIQESFLGIDIIGALFGFILFAAYMITTIITKSSDLINIYPLILGVLLSIIIGLLGRVYIKLDQIIVYNKIYHISEIESIEVSNGHKVKVIYGGEEVTINFRNKETMKESLQLLETYGLWVIWAG